jgi:hypothetical protein
MLPLEKNFIEQSKQNPLKLPFNMLNIKHTRIKSNISMNLYN